MNKICYGCGVKLQSEDKNRLGYIPAKKMDDAKYCMRCFRLINYGENKGSQTPKDVKEIVGKINKDCRFVIFLVDYLNINKETIEIFKSIKKEKVLVINKCELLPSSVKAERIKDYVHNYYRIEDDIIIKGGKAHHGAKTVINYLNDKDIKESYILGLSNSGKSTLINDIRDILKSNVETITVSKKANTTLDFIRVKMNDDLLLIDSPGFIIDHALNYDAFTKNIVAYSLQMKICETASLLDNKYFLKFDADTPIIFYTNADSKKNIKKYFRAAPNLVHTIEITENNMDVVLLGIGFVTIKKKCVITTNIPLENLEVRPSMFGGKYE